MTIAVKRKKYAWNKYNKHEYLNRHEIWNENYALNLYNKLFGIFIDFRFNNKNTQDPYNIVLYA